MNKISSKFKAVGVMRAAMGWKHVGTCLFVCVGGWGGE